MKPTLTPPAHCSFEVDDWIRLACCWHPVALASDVGPAPTQVTLLDEQLVVYRMGDEIVAARDICPHRGVPLSMGSHDGEGIVCPYHGLRFGAGGRCNRVPASPDQPIPAKLHLNTFAAREQYGLVWVCLAPPDGILPELPHMPHWNDAGFQQIVCPSFDIAGFAGRQIEGFLDVAHFAWVHTDTFADPDNQQVADYQPVETPYGFSVDYVSSVSNFARGSGRQEPEGFVWLRHFEMFLPFTATLTIHFPDDGRLVIMNAASPVSARKTRLFVPIARNFDLHIPVEDVHAFNLRVFEEDRTMVESQRPEHLPLDLTLEAHIPADRSSIAYRRGLKKLGYGEFFLV
ncbi:aromatic ring-hydroxylating dioxygenase subunit alpha [Dickeya sp. NCPPB 3274]|uniref:aromatic ring-hydroxylating oxygenase subunit alpha n=1 Tax=Dickeya sp. NCPPB 3274 TaxID=568766 RepID=UPI0003A79C34|nr:aromatic ring-hydroxylating dioxygenase subunit alpha [Dickeya sp. NCPPB 3274]